MAPIISAQGLSKRFGVAPLFQDISFTVSEGARIGLIGPNGSGKSTLLGILSGRIPPDSGTVAIRKGTRFSEVAQSSEFAPGETIRSIVDNALDRAQVPAAERRSRTAETLGRAGFEDQHEAVKCSCPSRQREAEGEVQALRASASIPLGFPDR